MSVVTLKGSGLNQAFKEAEQRAYDSLSSEFKEHDLACAIESEVSLINLNDYGSEIACAYASQAINRRSKPLPGQGGQLSLDGITRDFAENTVLKLGDGIRVKLVDATFNHLLSKQRQQNKAAVEAAESASRTGELLNEVAVIMGKNPSMTLGQAMVSIGEWK